MQFVASPNKILGLDISELSLKAVQIKKKKGRREIQALSSSRVPAGLIEEGVIKDRKKVAKIISQLVGGKQGKFTTKYAVITLPEPKTFIKVIEVADKQITEHKPREVIMRELPRHMPLTMEEVQVDWQEIGRVRGRRRYLVGAVDKAIADDYTAVCEMAGLEVVALEVEAQAIVRTIFPENKKAMGGRGWWDGWPWKKQEKDQGRIDKLEAKIILDMGATRTGLMVMDKGIIQFVNSLADISGEKITKKIMQGKKLSFAQAEKAKIICGMSPKKCRGAVQEIIKAAIDELAREIINADEFYQTHFGQETHEIEIVLTGGGAELAGIVETLQQKLKRSVSKGDPLANVNKALPRKINNLPAYTTAIGLALRNYIA